MSRGLEDYNNALMAFNTGKDEVNSYIASKRDSFFKDYNAAVQGAQSKFQSALAKQAEALGLDQERQEKLGNLIETSTLAAPIIAKAGMKAYGAISNRIAARASADTTAPASVTGTGSEATEGGEAGEAAEEVGEGAEEAEEVGGATRAAGQSIEMTNLAGRASQAAEEGAETAGAAARGLPSSLNLAQSSGGFLERGATEGAETAQEGQEATEEAEGVDEAGEAVDEAGEAGEAAEGIEAGEEGIATAAAGAEEATGGIFSEVIIPAAALASVGYGIYGLFHHSSGDESAAGSVPPPKPIVGHATGISDSLTRGGFAAAGIDSVTSLPAQNSAF